MSTTQLPIQLADLPLWRLIVALEDVERTVGPASSTARALVAEISRRLQTDRASDNPHSLAESQEVTRA